MCIINFISFYCCCFSFRVHRNAFITLREYCATKIIIIYCKMEKFWALKHILWTVRNDCGRCFCSRCWRRSGWWWMMQHILCECNIHKYFARFIAKCHRNHNQRPTQMATLHQQVTPTDETTQTPMVWSCFMFISYCSINIAYIRGASTNSHQHVFTLAFGFTIEISDDLHLHVHVVSLTKKTMLTIFINKPLRVYIVHGPSNTHSHTHTSKWY